jgi:hypothetical protein
MLLVFIILQLPDGCYNMWLKHVAAQTTMLCAVVGINILCTLTVFFTIFGNITLMV